MKSGLKVLYLERNNYFREKSRWLFDENGIRRDFLNASRWKGSSER